ncbi:HlyD family secretion protein [Pseudomonas saliphila]|uniref:HlyD family secretion protein n=1 Tax=Pseudomonas saliphila TaxID=2586906 RepID=UPI0019D5CEE8|nr:HlyD family efflux transporter periplasmic adaptor subunit [Pseudomonas saliphila]
MSVKRWLPWVAVVIVAALAIWAWNQYRPSGLPANIASGNGRIEATEIDIATKSGGRLLEVLVREGEFVDAGEMLAQVDTQSLQASLREAQAQVQQAEHAKSAAEAMVLQRESEKAAARAVVAQRQTELSSARNRYKRSQTLASRGSISVQQLEDYQAAVEGSAAALNAAKAQESSMDAAIAAARAQVVQAQSLIAAAEATVARLQVEIDDADLRAPRAGRVQYRVAEPGEVLGAGGRVLNMIDVSDVYMTFYLPTAAAGRVALGTEVRLVLDAAPDVVIPAKISFVASQAQFTPKTVETQSERLKLMFRVKASIDPELLRKYAQQVKTGLPGMAYVRLDESEEWPPMLQMRQVQ